MIQRQTLVRRIRGLVLGAAIGPVAAVVVAATGAWVWSASTSARPQSLLYPAKIARLSRQLVAEVQTNNAAAALATAQDYAGVVHELSVSASGVAQALRQERTEFVACVPLASSTTIGALQIALSSIDDVLGRAAPNPSSASIPSDPTDGQKFLPRP